MLLVTSSLRNYQKMFEIEFATKRVSRIYNVSKIKEKAATGYLYMIRPSYLARNWKITIPVMRVAYPTEMIGR